MFPFLVLDVCGFLNVHLRCYTFGVKERIDMLIAVAMTTKTTAMGGKITSPPGDFV
jgi:hypothetical protein